MENLNIAKLRPGANCGSDHQLLIAKFRLKLKKARKTTRPARYDLNQIPYEYAVEVMNRFKRLNLGNSGQRSVIFYRRQQLKQSQRKRKVKVKSLSRVQLFVTRGL